MRSKLSDKKFKREVFMESLDNLVKASSSIGLSKERARNVKDILGWAQNLVKRHGNGKV